MITREDVFCSTELVGTKSINCSIHLDNVHHDIVVDGKICVNDSNKDDVLKTIGDIEFLVKASNITDTFVYATLKRLIPEVGIYVDVEEMHRLKKQLKINGNDKMMSFVGSRIIEAVGRDDVIWEIVGDYLLADSKEVIRLRDGNNKLKVMLVRRFAADSVIISIEIDSTYYHNDRIYGGGKRHTLFMATLENEVWNVSEIT